MASSSTASAILNFASHYALYSGYVILTVGAFGNALNILVFTHLTLFRNNRCAFYLIVESTVGIGYLAVYFITNLLSTVYGNDPGTYSLVWCRMRSTLFQTFTLITFSIVCFAAGDQFCSTSHQFGMRQMCTLKLAQCLTCIAACIWLAHNIVFSSFYNIQPSGGCTISNEKFVQYLSYFFYPVLFGLLPIILSSIMSMLAFRNVRRIIRRQVPIVRRRLDRQMTAMVLTRVVFFVIFALPFTIYRIYATKYPPTRTDPLQYAFRQLVQAILTSCFALNFAVNTSGLHVILTRHSILF